MTPDELSERLWQFAARVGKVVDALPEGRLGRHVAGQLVRCAIASPWANRAGSTRMRSPPPNPSRT